MMDELEKVLLDQIEKLNQDDVMANEKELEALVKRSHAISELTENYIDLQGKKLEAQRLKIEAVKVAQEAQGLGYERYLGITDGRKP